jgi:hypothetical protein
MDTEVVAAGNLQGTKIHVKLSSEMEQKMKSLLDSEKNPPRPGATSSRGPPPSPPVETLGSAQLEARLADKGLSIEGTEEQKQDRLLAFYTAQSALSPEEKTAIEELVRNIVGDYIFKKAWSNGGKLYVKGGYNLLMRPDGLIQISRGGLPDHSIRWGERKHILKTGRYYCGTDDRRRAAARAGRGGGGGGS